MTIDIISAHDRQPELLELFKEYMDMLLKNDPSFAEFLKIQKYDDEVKDLNVKYGRPYGRLYLVYCDNNPAGCIALKKFDEENCEIKRLYVKPEYRGHNIGQMLTLKLLEDAKSIGYKHVLLDTLPFLETAIKMYENMGFYRIERYNNSPMETSIYMKYDLVQHS